MDSPFGNMFILTYLPWRVSLSDGIFAGWRGGSEETGNEKIIGGFIE
jgi:hypothetical protein